MIPNLSYQKVQQVYNQKGFKFFDNGVFNVNLFFIREDNVFENTLSDTMGICYLDDNNRQQVLTTPATTKAGVSPMVFNKALTPNAEGIAVVKPGYYPSTWQFTDSYVGWLAYPYFQQVKPITVMRDGVDDGVIHDSVEDTGLFGINIHRMGNVGIINSILGNWSEGCMGTYEPYLKTYLPIIREAVKRYGNLFSVAVFEKADFQLT